MAVWIPVRHSLTGYFIHLQITALQSKIMANNHALLFLNEKSHLFQAVMNVNHYLIIITIQKSDGCFQRCNNYPVHELNIITVNLCGFT